MADAIDQFLDGLDAAAASPRTVAGYRGDLLGVGGHVAAAAGVRLGDLRLGDLEKSVMRRAFAAWSEDHAAASTIRAWSAWNAFFRHLVAADVIEGNPMDGVAKPKRTRDRILAIRGPDVTAPLLAAAATADPRARHSWPERDVALVATLAVTGIRLGEAVALTVSCLVGTPAARRLVVIGSAGKPRALPVCPALDALLSTYLASRAARLSGADPASRTSPLFVHHTGVPLTPRQVQYLVERLYVRAGIRARVPAGALVHALRHTFATTALEGGADLKEVQRLLGHASADSTQRYVEALRR